MMQFNIVDTHAIYTHLLAAPDDATREAVFMDLIEPFEGLVKIFGWGQTGIQAFANWRMTPQQFAPDNHTHMRHVIQTLEQANQAAQQGALRFVWCVQVGCYRWPQSVDPPADWQVAGLVAALAYSAELHASVRPEFLPPGRARHGGSR